MRRGLGLLAEDEPLSEGEIDDGTDSDRDKVGDHRTGHVKAADEQPHDGHIANEREDPVAEVESKQAEEALTRTAWTVLPGEALMPGKVVEDGDFDCQTGVEIDVGMRQQQEFERGKLHYDTESADYIEFQPAMGEMLHGSRSSR